MEPTIYDNIALYTVELLLIAGFIGVVSYIIYAVTEYRKNSNLGSVDFGGDMQHAITENAVEEMVTSTVRDSNGYIQNNNEFIQRQLKIFTPSFDAERFSRFGAELFERFVRTKGKEDIPLVSKNLNLSALPASISEINFYYLHNYILKNNTENLKMFCAIKTKGNDQAESEKENYFLTFARENPLISIKNGKTLTISCPSCGSEIDMTKKMFCECPYCRNTIVFSEYDWTLTNIERITPDTKIINLAVFKKNE
ncbi:MAG: hypothetical protein J6A07_08640 [Firmicutes bacterium]|nr:hypothetical protein [Bacillota bacterium]